MRLVIRRRFDEALGVSVTEFEGSFTDADLIRARLDSFDRTLLRICGLSNSGADWLLGLETIYRKWEKTRS